MRREKCGVSSSKHMNRKTIGFLFSFAEYLAACCEDEGEENPP
jgi:hypothetical protein